MFTASALGKMRGAVGCGGGGQKSDENGSSNDGAGADMAPPGWYWDGMVAAEAGISTGVSGAGTSQPGVKIHIISSQGPVMGGEDVGSANCLYSVLVS